MITDGKLDAINTELARRKVVGTIESTQSAEIAAAAARDAAFREALTLVTTPLWDHGAPGAKGAQRAVRWVRAHAQEYGIDPHRIGMLGFSAGGHLTAMTSTLFDEGNPAAPDSADRMSSRPDFAVLAYAPVDLPKGATRDCFVGPEPGEKALREFSPAQNVSAATPPTFIFHTSSDELVPPVNATKYYDALRAAKVPAELHIFAEGRHGLGLAMTDAVLAIWPTLLANWLRARNLNRSGSAESPALD